MGITFAAGAFVAQATNTVIEGGTATVGIWFRRNGRPAGTQPLIFGKHSSIASAEGFGFYLENTAGANQDTLNLFAKSATQTQAFSIKAAPAIAFDGGWHLASGNLQVTSGAANDLYIDGGNKISANSGVNWDLTGQNIRLARSADTFWGNFDGSLAHAFLYKEILSDAEHRALAHGVSPLSIRPHALLWYLPLLGIDFIKNSIPSNVLAVPTTSGTLTNASIGESFGPFEDGFLFDLSIPMMKPGASASKKWHPIRSARRR